MPRFRTSQSLDFGKLKVYLDLDAGVGRAIPDRQTPSPRRQQTDERGRKDGPPAKRKAPESRHERARRRLSKRLLPPKLSLLDIASERFKARSFADLGCAWGVDGGYGLYCLDELGATTVTLVDAHTENRRLLSLVAERPRARFVPGGFGEAAVASEVGKVDAAILYDVLLHQVSPDWQRVLELYASNVRLFVVYNQQWTGPETVRLLDLGEEEYLKNVPHSIDDGIYRKVIEAPEEINPATGKSYRDSSSVWQWGITDADLISTIASLGFTLYHWEDHGSAFGLPNFRNRSFVFVEESQRS